jgi:hypothetical protein
MKLNVLTLALAATALSAFAANAQTVIEERRAPPAVVIEEPAPSTTIRTEERGGFLGSEHKTTTETTGTGPMGDCSTRTVHKEDFGGEKKITRTDCP